MSSVASVESMATRGKLRVLGSTCLGHMLHDGYSDLLYLLFPIWQAEFGLSFAAIGVTKTIFSGALSLFQIPAARFAGRFGDGAVLAGGTILIASAVFLYGFAGSVPALCALLLFAGLGAAVQHPISSSLVANAFAGPRLRTALGTYNFAGDAGKVLLPSAAAFIIWLADWRTATSILGLAGVALGIVLAVV